MKKWTIDYACELYYINGRKFNLGLEAGSKPELHATDNLAY
jgi:arginine decarboxylase-like protein